LFLERQTKDVNADQRFMPGSALSFSLETEVTGVWQLEEHHMVKTSLAGLAVAAALITPPISTPAQAGPLKKAVVIGSTVVVSGLVIRCGVRTVKGKSCL
jgi:hypothetical protein